MNNTMTSPVLDWPTPQLKHCPKCDTGMYFVTNYCPTCGTNLYDGGMTNA